MTNNELGHLYRALLYEDDYFTIAQTLSDEAAFNLYEEIERFGFDYYINNYQNDFDMNDFFVEKAKYYLGLSGKDSNYILENCDDFANKLKNFYLSVRNKKIHERMKDDSLDFADVIAAFDQSNIEESFDKVDMEETINISTPEEFKNFIEGTAYHYDSFLEEYDFSDEQKNNIIEKKEKIINELKKAFMTFLNRYYTACFKNLVDTNVDEIIKQESCEEIKKVIEIFRDYLGDKDHASYLEYKFNSLLAQNNNDELDSQEDEEYKVLSESSSDDLREDSDFSSSNLSGYEQLSNNELLVVLNKLIKDIKNSSNDSSKVALIEEANRLQSEYSKRIVAFSNSHKKTAADLKEEADSIRDAKHFTKEVKEQLVSDLYEEEGFDDTHKPRHMR